MQKIIAVLFACVLMTSVSPQKTITIKCGHLLDVRSGQVNTNQTILVKDNLVESISPPGAVVKLKADTLIDLSSYFVLPGLIDCHTHVLLQGDITSEDYDVQILKQSIPYRTIRGVRSCNIALMNGFTTIP